MMAITYGSEDCDLQGREYAQTHVMSPSDKIGTEHVYVVFHSPDIGMEEITDHTINAFSHIRCKLRGTYAIVIGSMIPSPHCPGDVAPVQ